MVAACFLFSVMSACVYGVSVCEPGMPVAVVSFVRVLINLAILVIPALFIGDLPGLFGDKRPSLWLRGLFGSLALIMSFASIQRIGPGESAFLGASSGVFVVLLGPVVLRQKNSVFVWLAVLGAMGGLLLLFESHKDRGDFLGRTMAMGSGFLSALAYLMVARSGRSNSPQTVIFYFCLVAVAIHLVYFGFYGYALPGHLDAWVLLFVAGIAASGAQMHMTRAYQMAPAALVSAVGNFDSGAEPRLGRRAVRQSARRKSPDRLRADPALRGTSPVLDRALAL
ncbi:MAG TPA: DMT family transporter [Bryobacteraceae bacterium]|nr:DMT family transporter [Bryobacteraceae bacterium]